MRILLVEDDAAFASALTTSLEANSLLVDWMPSLALAEAALAQSSYRMVLLDRQLPDGDGAQFVPRVRAIQGDVPVLLLTAKHHVADRVAGLDAGADDYLTKPFDISELLARIRALSRRPAQMLLPHLELGRLSFDFAAREAFIDGQPQALPRRQLLVLEALCLRQGRTVSRTALEEAVYGINEHIESNTLESHVSRLRRALAHAGVEIHTLRGVGYLIKASPSPAE
ncbi:MAG: response regulator transcription factor [Pseudoxanthomonas sp.]